MSTGQGILVIHLADIPQQGRALRPSAGNSGQTGNIRSVKASFHSRQFMHPQSGGSTFKALHLDSGPDDFNRSDFYDAEHREKSLNVLPWILI